LNRSGIEVSIQGHERIVPRLLDPATFILEQEGNFMRTVLVDMVNLSVVPPPGRKRISLNEKDIKSLKPNPLHNLNQT
jgi:hypothetical protein